MSRNNLDLGFDRNGLITKISGKYKDDLDILMIDEEVVKMLKNRKVKSKSNTDLEKYTEKSKIFIDEYRKIGRKKIFIDFGGKSKKQSEDQDPNDDNRLLIIGRYLFVLEMYIDVDVLHVVKNVKNCPSCNKKFLPTDEGEMYICECGYEREVFNIGANISTKSYYRERENFVKAVHRFAGRIEPNKTVIEELIGALDKHFTGYDLPSGAEIKKNNGTDKYGITKGTSPAMLADGLSAIGRPLYEFIFSIGHHYWGWVFPDIRHWETKIMDVYDKTQKVWERLPRERQSNITTQFRLFGTLKVIDFPCTKHQFKLVKSEDSLQEHLILWEIMLEGAGYGTESCKYF